MKRYMKLSALSLVASFALVGCGSSSATDENAQTGYFMDSAVIGADYNTSSGIQGITGLDGSFEYNDGDSVEFSLGKLSLGTASPATDGLITPKMLIAGDNTPTTAQADSITLLLRTLQSLDSDGDPTNGITITSTQIADLSTLDTTVSFHDLNESELIDLDNEHHLGLDDDYDGHLDVDADDADAHFQSTMDGWDHGDRPEDVGSDNDRGQDVKDGSDDGEQRHRGRDDDEESSKETHSSDRFVLADYPVTPDAGMTQELKDALAYMGNEERLAYDVYMNLYNYQLTENQVEIKQLKNIATKSEVEHVGIVQSLVQRYNLIDADLTDVSTPAATDESNVTFADMPSGKYDIPAIQDLYDSLYALGQTDTESALKVGCMVEVTDINDLDEYINLSEESNATDVTEAFKVMRDGSYNHYWAFDKGLKNLGVENGCYYEGDPLLGEDKTDIYPQNEH